MSDTVHVLLTLNAEGGILDWQGAFTKADAALEQGDRVAAAHGAKRLERSPNVLDGSAVGQTVIRFGDAVRRTLWARDELWIMVHVELLLADQPETSRGQIVRLEALPLAIAQVSGKALVARAALVRGTFAGQVLDAIETAAAQSAGDGITVDDIAAMFNRDVFEAIDTMRELQRRLLVVDSGAKRHGYIHGPKKLTVWRARTTSDPLPELPAATTRVDRALILELAHEQLGIAKIAAACALQQLADGDQEGAAAALRFIAGVDADATTTI